MKRERNVLEAIYKKVEEIAENPYHYKSMRAPMQVIHLVHIMNCFVLSYSINESSKSIRIVDFEHHDNAYH
jgi:mRNA-degrading endonuclease RelE of RelBE toxin-antitoxin system